MKLWESVFFEQAFKSILVLICSLKGYDIVVMFIMSLTCKLESNYKTVSTAEDFLSLCVIIAEDSTNAIKNNVTVWSLMLAEYHICVGCIKQLSNN